MQAPYIVGRWVSKHEHYARQSLINHLLTAQDNAYWLVGTRRMGKTSLLRQIEYLTSTTPGAWLPLFWDLQGCVTTEDLSSELFFNLQDAADRFAALGIDVAAFAGKDAVQILRTLNRLLAGHERHLLLLVDEAEVLADVVVRDPAWIARLRKALQEGNQRTIVASTHLLHNLTTRSLDWMTSPFLFGFNQMNLWPFDRAGALELVRQTQSGCEIAVEDWVLQDILQYTDQHPYLIQYLCQRLFIPTGAKTGYLRPLTAEDLALDRLLDAFFRTDFEQLEPLARRILLTTAESATITDEQITAVLRAEHSNQVTRQLRQLHELGHLRRIGDNWAIGSEFLQRWLRENRVAPDLAVHRPAQPGRLDEQNVGAVAKALGVAEARPDKFDQPAGASEDEFFVLVKRILASVRHLIEQDDGHKLLVNQVGGGKLLLRSEEEVQIALKHWLRPFCEAADIDLNREPLTGRGYLDFKLSIGRRYRCLVEVKLFNSSKLHDGVGIQLPLYLLADRASKGVYVPVFLEDAGYETAVAELEELARQRSASHHVDIWVMDIRAWKPKSASKADEMEALERYLLTPVP